MFFKRILQNFCRTPPVAASVYKNSFYKDQKKTQKAFLQTSASAFLRCNIQG